jgi:hypothetical protein
MAEISTWSQVGSHRSSRSVLTSEARWYAVSDPTNVVSVLQKVRNIEGVAAVCASLPREDVRQMLGTSSVPQLKNPPPTGFVWVYSTTIHGHGISLVALPPVRKPPQA